LNSDIIIRPDPEYRRRILTEQRTKMGVGVRRDGLHVSDLIFCSRKAWAERVMDFAENVPDETILLWVRGLSHEDLIADGIEQIRAGYCFQCVKVISWGPDIADRGGHCPHCDDTLMVGTIDWVMLESTDGLALDDFKPVEMKSTLKSSRKTLDDMPWYADQLKTYMAMHSRKKGNIAILHVMGDYSRDNPDIRGNGPKPELNVYEVEWRDPSASKNWLAEMRWRKSLVEGTEMPLLDSRSPAYDYICDFCIIGEKLPNGQQCEKWPWQQQPSGVYTRKGSKTMDMSMDDMDAELQKLIGETE
jgi:hypothetical protein